MKVTIGLFIAFLCSTASANVVSLNPSNYEELTSGKTVFIKFFAPWCGHCKAMAEDWVAIGEDFGRDKNILIGEVDCTDESSGNEDLCGQQNIQGFPTLKYGSPHNLEEYQGGRDYESLSAFAKGSLGPQCGPENVDLCSDEQKAELNTYMNMPVDELQALIDSKTKVLVDAQEVFQSGVQALEDEYNQANGGLGGREENMINMILDGRDEVQNLLAYSDEELESMLHEMQAQQPSEEELEALVASLQDRYEVLQSAFDVQRDEIMGDNYSLMNSIAEFRRRSEEKEL